MNPGSHTVKNNFFEIPKGSIIFSLCLHLGIFAYFSAQKGSLNPFAATTPEDKEKMKWTETLYQESIQVDMVALPDQMVNEVVDATNPIAKTPGTKTDNYSIPSPVKGEVVDTHKSEMEFAEKKKKAAAAAAAKKAKDEQKEREKALKSLKADADREEALNALNGDKAEGGRKKLKGNIKAKGTSAKGIIAATKDSYKGILKRLIEKNLEVRVWQKGKGLKAVIAIVIKPDGMVSRQDLVEKSKDSTFDQEAMAAIKKSEPFPVPEDLDILSRPFPIVLKPEE